MWDTINAILSSDEALKAIGALFTLIYALFKTTEWYQVRKENTTLKALDVVEMAVYDVAKAYTEQIKADKQDGKLTKEEQQNARSMAVTRAVQYAKKNGIDIATLFGGEKELTFQIERALSALKQEGVVK